MLMRYNVFSKNYRFKLHYVWIAFVAFGKYFSFRIPYFVTKGLNKSQIEAVDKVVSRLNGEKNDKS